MVFAFAGDSTINNFICFLVLHRFYTFGKFDNKKAPVRRGVKYTALKGQAGC